MRRWSAPGKLLLAGEYAALRPRRCCLVAAVDRRLYAESTPAHRWSVRSGGLEWREGDAVPEGLTFAAQALREASRLGAMPQAVVTTDELSVDGRKLGLGSSAAATVATLWAATGGLEIDSAERWRRADQLHRALQGGRGSGADVAASTFGGVLRYSREPHKAVPVAVHPDVTLVAVWTGASVKTSPRLARFEAFVEAHPAKAERFEDLSEAAVAQLAVALASADGTALREAVGAAREALRFLEAAAGLELETPALRRAVEVAATLGIGAKLSGAGGGDCAVALAAGDDDARRLVQAMTEAGLEAFELPVAKEGVRDEGI